MKAQTAHTHRRSGRTEPVVMLLSLTALVGLLLRAIQGVGAAADKAAPAPAKAPFDQRRAKQLQHDWAEHLKCKVEVTLDLGGVKMDFVLIPPGTFTMGSPGSEPEHSPDEDQHAVSITRAFYLGKYPVTQEQYKGLMNDNPSRFSAGKEGADKVKGLDTKRLPVEAVLWAEASAFCDKLAKKTGRKARLPTEAEWEYACRAGTTTPFNFGKELNGTQANCNGEYPYGTSKKGPNLGRTSAVGTYAPNAFGLYDMHGNVNQWCKDYYGPYKGLPPRDPLRAAKEEMDYRVMRNGMWFDAPKRCRAAARAGGSTVERIPGAGFRVAVPLD